MKFTPLQQSIIDVATNYYIVNRVPASMRTIEQITGARVGATITNALEKGERAGLLESVETAYGNAWIPACAEIIVVSEKPTDKDVATARMVRTLGKAQREISRKRLSGVPHKKELMPRKRKGGGVDE